jgi:hypothetical protein
MTREDSEAFSVKREELFRAFVRDEKPDASAEELAAAALELVLDTERLRNQVAPGTEAAAAVDRLTLSRMRAWDTDDPALAVIEKFLRRLAEDRGVDALTLLEKAINKKEQAVSDEQRRKASTPRKPHPIDQLIKELVAANPEISAKELERALRAQVGNGVIMDMDETDMYPTSEEANAIKLSSLPNRLTRARKS